MRKMRSTVSISTTPSTSAAPNHHNQAIVATSPVDPSGRGLRPGPAPAARSAAGGAGAPPTAVALDLEVQPERPGQVLRGEHLLQRSGGLDLPAPHEQRVAEAGRDLLDVVGDEDDDRGAAVPGELGERRHELLPAAEVEAGGGFVEEEQLRVGHERAGDLHPLALALAQRAELAVGEVVHGAGGEQVAGPGEVVLVIALPPPAGDAVGGREDDVEHGLTARDAVGEGGGGESDAGAQLPGVDGAQPLAEDVDGPLAREEPTGGHLQHRGLAGAVRAEHDPPLTVAHG